MVITKLLGGLGNQMFQYAHAKSISLKIKTKVKLDQTELLNRLHNSYTHREYELGIFNLKVSIATKEEIKPFFSSATFLAKILKKVGIERNRLWKESQTGVGNRLNNWQNIYLDGFWQSEKYFSQYKDQIIADFTFKDDPKGENLMLMTKIKSITAVSIHIRRGDYLTMPSAIEYHEICSLDYYYKAIEFILLKINDPYFFIFSDEPQWVIDNLKLDYPFQIITHNVKEMSFEDMRLMSVCKHNIIANSSFSWWGAWLNQNPNKIVIAPKRWFKDSTIDTTDLIPKDWIRI